MPERSLMSVDLPAPFSPQSACTSPGTRSNETSRNATTPGNRLVSERTSSKGAAMRTERGGLLELVGRVETRGDDGVQHVGLVDGDDGFVDARHVIGAVVDRLRGFDLLALGECDGVARGEGGE